METIVLIMLVGSFLVGIYTFNYTLGKLYYRKHKKNIDSLISYYDFFSPLVIFTLFLVPSFVIFQMYSLTKIEFPLHIIVLFLPFFSFLICYILSFLTHKYEGDLYKAEFKRYHLLWFSSPYDIIWSKKRFGWFVNFLIWALFIIFVLYLLLFIYFT